MCEKQTDNSISSDAAGTDSDRNTPTSDEHQIRIAVDFDYEKCCVNKHLELHSSLSSSSTVSNQDKRQVEAHNEVVALQQLFDQQQNYTEKAIDVPKEFEENAYSGGRRQNGWSLRHRENQYSSVSAPSRFIVEHIVNVFFIVVNSPISQNNNNNNNRTRPQTEYFASEADNCSDDLNMGNGCSAGNFRRRRHNAIAPHRHPTKLHEISIGDATTKSRFSLAPKPRRLSATRGEYPKCIGAPKSIDGFVQVRAAATPAPVPLTHNRNSLIDENSILSDANDTPRCSVTNLKPRPSFVRSASVDSATTDAIIRRESVDDVQVKNENRNLSKLYRQISGSVQSLFQTNLNFNKKRQLSASDTNLNVCVQPKNNHLLLSQQQLIDSNYCPSVLYSRKSRKATSESNLGKIHTFHRWKNHLWLRMMRKKSDTSVRPSKT